MGWKGCTEIMKKIVKGLVLLLVLAVLAGCGEKTTAYTFEGFKMEIPEKYILKEVDTGNDMAWLDEDSGVGLWVDHYSDEWLAENNFADYTIDDIAYNMGYGQEILSETDNGTTYDKKYLYPEGDNYNVFRHCRVYETNDGYWSVVLDCMEADQKTYEPLFEKWFKSVTIND